MFAPYAFLPERNDLYKISSLLLEENEAILFSQNKTKLCVPFEKIELFRQTGYVDHKNYLLYEEDVLEVHFVYDTCSLVGFTTIKFNANKSQFVVEPFLGIFPDSGEVYFQQERFQNIFEFESLAALVMSPSNIYRVGNYYEVEKADNDDKRRAMYGITKYKKDLKNIRPAI